MTRIPPPESLDAVPAGRSRQSIGFISLREYGRFSHGPYRMIGQQDGQAFFCRYLMLNVAKRLKCRGHGSSCTQINLWAQNVLSWTRTLIKLITTYMKHKIGITTRQFGDDPGEDRVIAIEKATSSPSEVDLFVILLINGRHPLYRGRSTGRVW